MSAALSILQEADYLSDAQKAILRKARANIALVNAINHCSINEPAKAVGFLKDAAARSPRIVFDPRFGYTIFRLLKKRAASLHLLGG